MKCLQDFWVEVQDEVLLLGNLHVPFGNHIAYPVGKRCTDNRIGDVHYPLTRNLVHVPIVWQVLHHQIVLACLLKDVLNCQSFILWTSQELHLIAFEEKFLLSAEVWKSKIVVRSKA